MATAAFKSNSKRSNGSPKTPKPPPQKQRLRRSLSVNALSRSTPQLDISEFLNKRDNPLYWATGGGGSPPAQTPTSTPIAGVTAESKNVRVDQRGRSVNRNSDGSGQIGGRRRSLSRAVDNRSGSGNGLGRRGRSVSRANLGYGASESQESRKPSAYGGKSGFIRASAVSDVKTFDNTSFHPSVGSSFDSNWEDGVSTSSLSEAEERTIKAVYEQMKSFEGDNSRKTTGSSEIYETVRSEVRRAIADIQDDLQHAIRRNSSGNADVSDISPKPGAVELVLDIRREYTKELEESEERARKLRSDLAIEEHRKQELSRILKETLPEPKTSSSHRSRLGRKSSSERKKMSKRLTDEAMSYFDEYVSISTFDSSDFSAAEDPSVNSMGPTTHQQTIHGSSSVADSASNEVIINRVEFDKKFRFSFGHKPTESIDELKNYIKTFEKDKDGISLERLRNGYNVDAYNVVDVNESLLFDKLSFKTRQESGSLHICGGVVVPFLPLGHFF